MTKKSSRTGLTVRAVTKGGRKHPKLIVVGGVANGGPSDLVALPMGKAVKKSGKNTTWALQAPGGAVESALKSVQGTPVPSLGRAVVLNRMSAKQAAKLHEYFRAVTMLAGPRTRRLPTKQLLEILQLPNARARELFIGGVYNSKYRQLSLTKGDFKRLTVPTDFFKPCGGLVPDFDRFAIGEYGHLVVLGEYEAAGDGILYEFDPDYRRRQAARRPPEEQGFGPALRRLRRQRGLKISEFDGVDPDVVERIERGDLAPPHALAEVLAARLGVAAGELSTY